MKVYDFPDRVSLADRFIPWTKANEEEITKALSDKFTHTYKPQIEYAKNDILNSVSGIIFIVFICITVLVNFTIAIFSSFLVYWILSFCIKFCAKKCAVHIFESITKHDVLEKCFADILDRELAEAETDEQQKIVREFYQYAICRTYDINFNYKK